MRSFAPDTIELLDRLYGHGPITLTEFKEAFPKVMRPSYTLQSLVASGALRRREDGFYSITEKGRRALADHSGPKAATPTAAGSKSVSWTEGNYNGQRMTPMREGAEDHLRIPSLIGGQRVYRKDGHA